MVSRAELWACACIGCFTSVFFSSLEWVSLLPIYRGAGSRPTRFKAVRGLDPKADSIVGPGGSEDKLSLEITLQSLYAILSIFLVKKKSI